MHSSISHSVDSKSCTSHCGVGLYAQRSIQADISSISQLKVLVSHKGINQSVRDDHRILHMPVDFSSYSLETTQDKTKGHMFRNKNDHRLYSVHCLNGQYLVDNCGIIPFFNIRGRKQTENINISRPADVTNQHTINNNTGCLNQGGGSEGNLVSFACN